MIIQNQENRGYIGIGTENPQSALHIIGNTGGIASFNTISGTGGLSNVKLLINSNTINGSATFTDSSNSNHTINVNNNPIHSTDQQKFGTSSIYFPFNNDDSNGLVIPNSNDFDLGTNDFTIECWVYITEFPPNESIIIGLRKNKSC
jgi:hypothetical protein